MRLEWEAAYLDGRTAARRPATVQITRTGLDVAVPESGARFFWPFREIRQTQGTYAGEQVRLEHGGALPEALLIADVGFLSAARAASPEAALGPVRAARLPSAVWRTASIRNRRSWVVA